MQNERLKAKNISIAFVQSESESAQIGGLIKKALPAAFAAALSQATNAPIRSLPLKAEDIFKAVLSASAKEKDGEK